MRIWHLESPEHSTLCIRNDIFLIQLKSINLLNCLKSLHGWNKFRYTTVLGISSIRSYSGVNVLACMGIIMQVINFSHARFIGGSQEYIVQMEARSSWNENNIFVILKL
jgi:hypothetical protein